MRFFERCLENAAGRDHISVTISFRQCWLMTQKSLPLSIRFHLGGFFLRERLRGTEFASQAGKTRSKPLRRCSELDFNVR